MPSYSYLVARAHSVHAATGDFIITLPTIPTAIRTTLYSELAINIDK